MGEAGAKATTPIAWAPQPGSQTLFMSCPIFECLYDGTRGPGKTDALLMDFAQHVGRGYGPAWRGILFREEATQMEDLITKSMKWFPLIFPGAQYIGQPKNKWVFPKGEELLFRHMRVLKDYWSYHGHEYPWIGWEELTNWANGDCYDAMKSCCRSSDPDMPRKIRATCNPYGAGHHWVKRRFVDPAPAGTVMQDERGRARVRIHGTIYENKILLAADPDYLTTLEDIEDDNLRKAWLEGSWDILAGMYFDCWRADKHVIEPFAIPDHWTRIRSFDWGSAAPFSVGWYAISDGSELPDGRIYPAGAMIKFREWYGASKPNVGLKLTAEEVADGIKERESGDKLIRDTGQRVHDAVADPSIGSQDGGPSIMERMAKRGVRWRKADNARVSRHGHIGGWDQMRARLIGEDGKPMLYFFETCRDSIRTIPAMPHSDVNPEDVDTTAEDHCADETRYACVSRPWTRSAPAKPKPIVGVEGLVIDRLWRDAAKRQNEGRIA